MIPYKSPEEKEAILFYADLLKDEKVREIIERDQIQSKDEARHLAGFYWKMVERSNEDEDRGQPNSCDYLLEKIIITFMAYFRSAGYEAEWDEFADL